MQSVLRLCLLHAVACGELSIGVLVALRVTASLTGAFGAKRSRTVSETGYAATSRRARAFSHPEMSASECPHAIVHSVVAVGHACTCAMRLRGRAGKLAARCVYVLQ